MFLEHNIKSCCTKIPAWTEKNKVTERFDNLADILLEKFFRFLFKHAASTHIAALVVWFG